MTFSSSSLQTKRTRPWGNSPATTSPLKFLGAAVRLTKRYRAVKSTYHTRPMTDPWCWYINANIIWGYIDGIHAAPKKKQHQSDPSWDTYHCDKLNIIEPCLSVWVLGCFYCITYYRDLSRSPMPWSLPESQLLAIPSQSLNVAGEGINHAMEPVWVKQCHKRTIPPVIIFIGDIRKPFPEMGGLWPWKKKTLLYCYWCTFKIVT